VERSRLLASRQVVGKFTIKPRVVVHGQFVEKLWRDFNAVVFVARLDAVLGLLAAPVFTKSKTSSIKQVTREGWVRRLGTTDVAFGGTPAPILLSTQTNWVLHEGEFQGFGTAFIVDGAARVESRIRAENFGPAVFLALLGMTDADELTLRAELTDNRSETVEVPEQKVDTDTPRYVVTTRWTRLTIESDPFVVPTVRGYVPALLVKRQSTPYREHVLIGAKSLARPLEELRASRGSLSGQRIRIRKESDQATAPYELEVIT